LKDKELDCIPWRNHLEEALDFSQGRRPNECIHLNRLSIIKMALDKLIVLLYFSSKFTHINSNPETHDIGLWYLMLKCVLLFFNEKELNWRNQIIEHKYFINVYNNQLEFIGGACSTYDAEERSIQGFRGETTWKIWTRIRR